MRFIPTYVGHTSTISGSSAGLSVHPHIRGAYIGFLGFQPFNDGSSPHTWGIHGLGILHQVFQRFIPTYVGHTKRCCRWSNDRAVHPHIRGAYLCVSGEKRKTAGSSPHTWGILSSIIAASSVIRFIPTYVGHTPTRFLGRCIFPVHPHIRGAYAHCSVLVGFVGGSSPHTWGIRCTPFRSVPACTVHPHIRGAYWYLEAQQELSERFIPTYVGHTLRKPGRLHGRSVHPHIRGAYIIAQGAIICNNGSSPHTWGIQCLRLLLRLLLRFIPTYVGHTGPQR